MRGVPVGLAIRAAVVAVAVAGLSPRPAAADTLLGALAQAYQVNPQLNSQRAIVRQTDESVPQALSGYRPRANATASIGKQYTNTAPAPAGPQLEGTSAPLLSADDRHPSSSF